jgi:hypothetical protein
MRMTAKQRKEFERLDAALAPARDLIIRAVDAMVARARRAKSLPDIPDVALSALNEAISIMAAMGRLPRSGCSKVVEDEFLIRLVLRLEDLECDGITELMAHTRTALDTALLQQ